MTCYHPKEAWQLTQINPDTGSRPKPVFQCPSDFDFYVDHYERQELGDTGIFYDAPVYASENPKWEHLMLPCGKCLGCLQDRARQWAVRCVHEASIHDDNCFITLTFDDDHIRPDFNLDKKIYVDFMKRLRKRFGDNIRFFHCGEYGNLNYRPHHHAIIFNFDFPDKELWSLNRGIRLYRSEELEKLWPFGFSTIGAVSFESAAYVARYTLKKIGFKGDKVYREFLKSRNEPYITMSRRPGIAHDWYVNFKKDVYPHDYVVINNGIQLRPPRYYDKLFDLQYPEIMKEIKDRRRLKALENENELTSERLSVKEQIAHLKADKLKREL